MMSGPIHIFNPEHDLCLANGDPNFVPPESALKFGRDCAGLTSWIDDKGGIVTWGWDMVLKRRLIRDGVPDDVLPPDSYIAGVRALSHRENAVNCRAYLIENVDGLSVAAEAGTAFVLNTEEQVAGAVECFGNAVAKAPWSGSGKGLRWLRAGEISAHDMGWCRNVIAKQGSVIVEKRCNVVQDFAMLFNVSDDVSFDGMSLFFNDNGMYRGNVLASDRWILSRLSEYVDGALLLRLKDALSDFFRSEFLGKYCGHLGVDMFIYADGSGNYKLCPCVEINVRMTMGLLARRIFDRHLQYSPDSGLSLRRNVYGDGVPDNGYVLRVDYSPADAGSLQNGAVAVIAGTENDVRYTVAIYGK